MKAMVAPAEALDYARASLLRNPCSVGDAALRAEQAWGGTLLIPDRSDRTRLSDLDAGHNWSDPDMNWGFPEVTLVEWLRAEYPGSNALLWLPLSLPRDESRDRRPRDWVVLGDEVYSRAGSADSNETWVDVLRSHNPAFMYHCFGIDDSVGTPSDLLDPGVVESSLRFVVVGAYDGEGYVVLRR